MKLKRVAAIHDISCFGKCSLTVALPIISAAGIETSVIPTSVLSTHTSGFEGYTFLDLTDEILKIAEHWHKLGLHFDAVYTGFLSSAEQIEIVCRIIDLIASDDTVVIVDPAMADNGKLYPCFDSEFPSHMKTLCARADIMLPNITEASLLLDTQYLPAPHSHEYIESLLRGLHELSSKDVVLTGVDYNGESLGAACYFGDKLYFTAHEKIPRSFHGTGDVFASAFVAALENGNTRERCADIAVAFTCRSILKTIENNPERQYGVNFEQAIPSLLSNLGLTD